MPTAKTKTFMSGNSEALRLPREMAYGPGVELTLVRSGDVLTVYPTPKRDIGAMIEALEALPKPEKRQKRARVFIPDRGLS